MTSKILAWEIEKYAKVLYVYILKKNRCEQRKNDIKLLQ